MVEVAPSERPPVCRIMDYGKYKYEKKKKASRNTSHSKTKEVRLRPKTGDHDIQFKVNQAKKFLKHKDKVQVSVLFRGREMAHIEELTIQKRYGDREWSPNIVKRLEEQCGEKLLAPGFPSQIEDYEPEVRGAEVELKTCFRNLC